MVFLHAVNIFPVFWRNISHKHTTDIITGIRGLKLFSIRERDLSKSL